MAESLKCSVIIPTYNRARLLRHTLDSLVRQTLPADQFEVLVVDDGSSDSTADLVGEYQGVLNLRYFFQEDEGWRVAKARNVGIANATAGVCVFLDSGVLAHSTCLAAHVESHVSATGPVAVTGYVFCFNADNEDAKLINQAIDFEHPDATIETLREQRRWLDIRELFYAKYTDDFHDRVPAPWLPFWTCNASANTAQLRAVGMFDEEFRSWGAEDVDLAYRLFLDGARVVLNRAAAAIHAPHDKNFAENMRDSVVNCKRMVAKYGTPIIELLAEDPVIPFFDVNDVVAERGLPNCADFLAEKGIEVKTADAGRDAGAPRVSVVIPTYNRCELLGKLLDQLAGQSVPASEFEVIVADDGSVDATKDVVNSFADRLRIKYHYQEDLGFRAALARNAGARLAEAPVLVFLDTGAMIRPSFLAEHLKAHVSGRRHAVAGYIYGFNPTVAPKTAVRALVDEYPLEDVVREHGDDPDFWDLRHEQLAPIGFDLSRAAVPFRLFWTGNCSIRTADFWAVGGFDESFVGYGAEDVEFGYRVNRAGMSFTFSTEAWSLEYPHERDSVDNMGTFYRNFCQFQESHTDPVVELGWALFTKTLPVFSFSDWEDVYQELLAVSGQVRGVSVREELAGVASEVSEVPAGRVAVVGAGGEVPDSLSGAVLIDFDRELLDRALAGSGGTGFHAVGLRTPLADQSVDTVVLTSRLAPLWPRWGEALLAEANRIGRDVRVLCAPSTSNEATG